MPKLDEKVIVKKRMAIARAAKELFIRQGFHATSMRDIARRARVSLGNLYNYFETKESIFEFIINDYVEVINGKLKNILDQIDEPLEPRNLRFLGDKIGELVNEHSDFWLLMYIDVLEFRNRHFRKMFDGLAENFRRRFSDKFEAIRQRGDLRVGVDPACVFTAAYMQFFNYFLVEKLFGGNQHLGLSDGQALNFLTKLFCYGSLSSQKLAELKREFIFSG
ncbi:MAG: TetR/AcrR family transcriptional regulator [Pyrinomonadaceae bacterium]|nr:TetR/AcrR family transcriptional regulator [Pyrinomonadaceae bacterium]MCX7640020.1 TetR/AcrR family transcriptional regulator [Pyrinomonadaceae bacterium]MDW8304192.1 TetR/AcrR family transcriptional regulator [Acidobacteriota bacterium]